MRTDERFKPICLRILRRKSFYDLDKASAEELSAIVDFLSLLKEYKDNYDNIPFGRIVQLFSKED